MKKLVSMALVGFMFSMGGCASTITTTTKNLDGTSTTTSQPGSMFGPSSYDVGFAGMHNSWRESQTKRSASIVEIPCPNEPTAAAYCNMSKMMGISMMSMERFDVKAPITGFDVLYKLTDSVVPVAGFTALYKLGVSGIQAAGSTFGNDATLTNSLNHTNPTTTNVGTGSAASSTSGTMPATEPVIVEPSYAPIM